jgi:hypothetical protein
MKLFNDGTGGRPSTSAVLFDKNRRAACPSTILSAKLGWAAAWSAPAGWSADRNGTRVTRPWKSSTTAPVRRCRTPAGGGSQTAGGKPRQPRRRAGPPRAGLALGSGLTPTHVDTLAATTRAPARPSTPAAWFALSGVGAVNNVGRWQPGNADMDTRRGRATPTARSVAPDFLRRRRAPGPARPRPSNGGGALRRPAGSRSGRPLAPAPPERDGTWDRRRNRH